MSSHKGTIGACIAIKFMKTGASRLPTVGNVTTGITNNVQTNVCFARFSQTYLKEIKLEIFD